MYPFVFNDALTNQFITQYFDYVTPEDFDIFEEDGQVKDYVFLQAMHKVDKSKSPGSPLIHVFPSNAGLHKITNQLYEEVNSRILQLFKLGRYLWKLTKLGTDVRPLWGYDYNIKFSSEIAKILLQFGCTDPFYQKVKGEVRKLGKMPRLVSMYSVLDTIIQRLLYNDMLYETRKHSTPVATQLDITTQAETKKLYDEFKSHAPLITSDVQGWDYSTHPHHLLVAMKVHARVSGVIDILDQPLPGKEKIWYLMLAQNFCQIHRVLQTEEGELLSTYPGLTTSGKLDTFNSNSIMRAFVSVQSEYRDANINAEFPLVGRPVEQKFSYLKCAGDDCMTTAQPDVFTYRNLGFVLTDVASQTDEFSFCSTTFGPQFSYQQNIEKFFVQQMYDRSNWSEKLAAMQMFEHHPWYSRLVYNMYKNSPVDDELLQAYSPKFHKEMSQKPEGLRLLRQLAVLEDKRLRLTQAKPGWATDSFPKLENEEEED